MGPLTEAASMIPPQAFVYIALGILALLLYHIREDSQRRREMYEELRKNGKLLHRIAGRLEVDDKNLDDEL